MPVKPSIQGQRFGRLLVIRRQGTLSHPKWVCKCDCGRETEASYTCLTKGDTKSCGCLRQETAAKLGRTRALPMRGTAEYRTWVRLKGRCYNPSHQDFNDYGGRGITVSQVWLDSFDTFLLDMGLRPEGASIDRVDVNGNYEAGNCRWAQPDVQANNRRTSRFVEFSGRRMTVAQWASTVGVSKECLLARLNAGWPVQRALTETTSTGQVLNIINQLEAARAGKATQ